MQNILSIKGLKKTYSRGLFKKKNQVLHGVDFHLEAKSLTGFLGSNGAGKSTTIKCILGLVTPDEGEINFFGNQKINVEVKKNIGFLPEKPHFYEHLTGEEFLIFSSGLVHNLSKREHTKKAHEVLKIVGLYESRHLFIREYSKGMYQRIGIAQSIIHKPSFLILDEPMSDLDPQGRNTVKETLEIIRQQGMTIILSSHLLHDIEDLCENIVILKDGKTAYQGKTQGFLESIQSGYNLVFENNGKAEQLFLHSLIEVQSEIDKLLKQKKNILSLNAKKPSLEEAFVKLVSSKRTQ
jgi:ABC-2 type transport system ATP-binding protein